MQLAGAQPGLFQALLRHQLNNLIFTHTALILAMALLVIRLTAHAHITASPRNTQALDEATREELPEGFFVTLTP